MLKNSKKFIGFLLILLVLAAPLVAWWQSNALYDWYRLRDYTPPASIVSLANQDTFKPYTRHLFYVNRPQLLNTVASFRQDCPENENTIVLGCYHSGQQGIYIYNVQDSALAGVQQVTAAHEVLHSVYARLSTKQRNYVDGLLENYYKNDLHDPRVLDEVKLYQQTEPNDVMDEMHSTFGTEIAGLPLPLEKYYQQYFSNRQAIVTFEQNYQGEFTNRENQVNADDTQLAALKQQIDSEEQSLSQQSAQINSDRAHLDSLRSSGQTDAYNAAVGPFNDEVSAYNQGVDQLKSDIASYNDLVNSRNAIAQDLASLDKALDTRLSTQSAQ